MTRPAASLTGRSAHLGAVALLALLALPAPAHAGRKGPAPAAAVVMVRPLDASMRQHTLAGLDGTPLTLASLHGEVVVLNFWASWCAPCRRELPELDALHREIAARGGRVLAVSIDEDVQNARRFSRTHALTMTVAHDGPDGLAAALDLAHVPYTLVLDRRGRVALGVAGSDREALDRIAATARRLLDGEPATDAVPETP